MDAASLIAAALGAALRRISAAKGRRFTMTSKRATWTRSGTSPRRCFVPEACHPDRHRNDDGIRCGAWRPLASARLRILGAMTMAVPTTFEPTTWRPPHPWVHHRPTSHATHTHTYNEQARPQQPHDDGEQPNVDAQPRSTSTILLAQQSSIGFLKGRLHTILLGGVSEEWDQCRKGGCPKFDTNRRHDSRMSTQKSCHRQLSAAEPRLTISGWTGRPGMDLLRSRQVPQPTGSSPFRPARDQKFRLLHVDWCRWQRCSRESELCEARTSPWPMAHFPTP